MAQIILGRGLLLTLEDLKRTPPKRRSRRRLPLEVSDFIRQALAAVQDHERSVLKRLIASSFQVTTQQLDAIEAWSNGKLKHKRRK